MSHIPDYVPPGGTDPRLLPSGMNVQQSQRDMFQQQPPSWMVAAETPQQGMFNAQQRYQQSPYQMFQQQQGMFNPYQQMQQPQQPQQFGGFNPAQYLQSLPQQQMGGYNLGQSVNRNPQAGPTPYGQFQQFPQQQQMGMGRQQSMQANQREYAQPGEDYRNVSQQQIMQRQQQQQMGRNPFQQMQQLQQMGMGQAAMQAMQNPYAGPQQMTGRAAPPSQGAYNMLDDEINFGRMSEQSRLRQPQQQQPQQPQMNTIQSMLMGRQPQQLPQMQTPTRPSPQPQAQPAMTANDIMQMSVGNRAKDMQYDLNGDGRITSADALAFSKRQPQAQQPAPQPGGGLQQLYGNMGGGGDYGGGGGA